MKKIPLILILLAISVFPNITHAQITTSGCYTCPASSNANGCTRVGSPDLNGQCAQGAAIFVDTKTGLITPGTGVSNGLSYVPLEPLPGQPKGAPTTFCSTLNLLFKVLIYLGGMIAVLFLVIGGIAYMISEVVNKKAAALNRIRSSLIGLLILLGSYLILFTVNPTLVNACSVLDGNTGGVVADPSALAAQRQTQAQIALQACTKSWFGTPYTYAAGTDINTMCKTATGSIPECGFTVGRLATAGRCCEVLIAPTQSTAGVSCERF